MDSGETLPAVEQATGSGAATIDRRVDRAPSPCPIGFRCSLEESGSISILPFVRFPGICNLLGEAPPQVQHAASAPPAAGPSLCVPAALGDPAAQALCLEPPPQHPASAPLGGCILTQLHVQAAAAHLQRHPAPSLGATVAAPRRRRPTPRAPGDGGDWVADLVERRFFRPCPAHPTLNKNEVGAAAAAEAAPHRAARPPTRPRPWLALPSLHPASRPNLPPSPPQKTPPHPLAVPLLLRVLRPHLRPRALPVLPA